MAGEVGAMAGEVRAAGLQALVQYLIDLSTNLSSLIYGLDGEAQNLRQNLLTIQQFLNDAETRTITSGDVKIWLNRLENAAFEADDVLDELDYHALASKLNTDITKKKVPFIDIILSPFTDIGRKRKMGVLIQEINMNFNSINKMATRLGLHRKLADAPTVPYAGMETDSFSADPIFIGRDEVVSEIVETLVTSVATHDDERVFSILPIVGMGGLGKTTLTRKVFHHQKMDTQFGSRIWVHVSEVFDPINLFKKILEALSSSQSGQVESKQGILSKLKEALKDKTYLLVLDDAWNEEPSKWEDFLNSLLGVTNTKGNAIIVTTRSMKVASIEGALRIHKLKGLSEKDCWKIISAKTFGNEDVVPLDIESVGREIAKRCGGLPLAASVVGGVLQCDKSVDKWVSIRDDWLPEGEEEGENNITKILRLSFNNLSSPSLKKCFAYCSIFPKGEEMEKDELIKMWMGEGFLGSNEDMESVGDKFYNVLLHSSLLQVQSFLLQNGDWCVMHDLVHDLASSVLGNADGVSRVRYLIHKEGESSPITKEVAQHVRTLIFQADEPFDDNIFSDFKSLHVLILRGESFKELPRSIRKLIHLRNLNIAGTDITHLPDWIGKLHHLQTIRSFGMEKLPSTIKYLINLRHLHVEDELIEVELPAEIGRLTSLQTLWREFTVLDKNGYKIEELGSLNNLKGSLTIEGLKKVHDKEEAEKANLSKKSKLSELHLEWEDVESSSDESVLESDDDSEKVEKVLEGLQPHSNLMELTIKGFEGKRFPEWTMNMAVRNETRGSWVGLNQLVAIKFDGCRECEEIPMLGHLPNLKSLKIGFLSNVKSINSSFYGIGNETGVVFPVLETLKLCDMDSLKEWAEVESGSTSEVKVFPHLRSLNISNCNQLMKVPFNQLQLSCLESLEISGCNQLTTDSYLPLLSKLTSITDLVLEGLNGLESLPDELFDNNPNLSVLKISKCPKLREIPDGLQSLYFLNELIIEECPDLKRIRCPRIKEYHGFIGGFSCLTLLGIRECHGLMDFPYELLESWDLKKVALEGLSSLSNLPRLIECLAKSAATLTNLTIVGVPKFLATSVDQVWHFHFLERLVIDVSTEGSGETSVASVDRILRGCSCDSLSWLSLTGMDSWECLPESIQRLTSLYRLELNNFGMEELPEWFDQYISSCTDSWFRLHLYGCKRLKCLPSTQAMQRLIEKERVDIMGCPELQQQQSR